MAKNVSPKHLAKIATLLLRTRGYTAAGRRTWEIRREQVLFERRILSTPMGGQPPKR